MFTPTSLCLHSDMPRHEPVRTSQRSLTMQDNIEALQEQLRDLRLSHRRELRLKAREAASAHEELQAARAKVRELNVKTRQLQSVCLYQIISASPGAPERIARGAVCYTN